jgi:uncharacterized membrane protein
MDMICRRFACGEIDRAEYEENRKLIEKSMAWSSH